MVPTTQQLPQRVADIVIAGRSFGQNVTAGKNERQERGAPLLNERHTTSLAVAPEVPWYMLSSDGVDDLTSEMDSQWKQQLLGASTTDISSEPADTAAAGVTTRRRSARTSVQQGNLAVPNERRCTPKATPSKAPAAAEEASVPAAASGRQRARAGSPVRTETAVQRRMRKLKEKNRRAQSRFR